MKKNIVINIIGSLIIIGFLGKICFEKNFHQEMAVYINDEYSTEFPKKGKALFQRAVCNNDAKVSWNNDSWSLLINNLNEKTKCNLYFYQGETIYNFDYTGGEQTFIAPVSGTYKLETWGSSGYVYRENSTYNQGGVGGYAVGKIKLVGNQILYINVGGAGYDGVCTDRFCRGGYNGGGRGAGSGTPLVYSGSGGGATHIAKTSGVLSSLQNELDKILIVAGGGAGNSYQSLYGEDYSGIAGVGGGFIGGDGTTTQKSFISGKGGSQTSGGSGSGTYKAVNNTNRGDDGSFGQGGNGNYYSGGGGGGFYGGGASNQSGGGGGSGYIGNSLLKDKVMYCYNCQESNEESTKTISTTCISETPIENCAKGGYGYARITLVSIDE